MSDSLGPHRLQARLPWTREDCKAQPFPQVQAWGYGFQVLFCFVLFFNSHIYPFWHLVPRKVCLGQLFTHSLVSDSWPPHGLQHTRLPCPSLSPGVWSNSCPLSGWCYPTISSSVVPFFSCPQSFPASGSFPTNWLITSGGQRIGASALVLPMIFRVDFH